MLRPSPLLPVIVSLLSVTLALAACGDDTGQASVSFTWESPPQEAETLWLTIEVQQRTEAGTPGVVLAAIPPQSFVFGEPLRFTLPSVPNGDDRRVIVEVRRSSVERVSYYGISETFSIRPGESNKVSVAVALRAPLTDVGNTVELSYPSGALTPGADDMCDTTVTAVTANAVWIEIANNASFENLQRINVREASSCEQVSVGYRCVVEGFQLRTVCPGVPQSSVYALFARFVDALNYPSATLPIPVQVDITPPTPVFSFAGPAIAQPGSTVFVTVTTNEAADDAVLTITGDPEADPVPPPIGVTLGAGTRIAEATWEWAVQLDANGIASGTRYGFEVALRDPAGNQGLSERLVQASGAGDLTLVVDSEAPTLSLLSLTVNDDDPIRGADGVIYVTAEDVVEAVVQMTDDIGLANELVASAPPLINDITDPDNNVVCTNDRAAGTPTDQQWACTLTMPKIGVDNHFEGRIIAAIAEFDLAGNRVATSTIDIQADDTPPSITGLVDMRLEDDFGPAREVAGEVFYRPGAVLSLRFAVNEPLPDGASAPSLTIAGTKFEPVGFLKGDFIVEFNVSGALPEGSHDIVLTVSDIAGNVGTPVIATLHADETAPAAPSAAQQPLLTLYRAPDGVLGDPLPRYELRVCPGQWSFCDGVDTGPFEPGSTVTVHRADGPTGCDAATVTSARADDAGGATVTMGMDLSAVCVSSTDRAGNLGPPVRVEMAEWTGNTRAQALGGDGGLSVGQWSELTRALMAPGELLVQSGEPLDAIDDAAVETVGAAEWRRVSSPSAPLAIARRNAPLVTDLLSGGVWLGPGCVSDGAQTDCTEVNESDASDEGGSLLLRWNGSTMLPVGAGIPGTGPRGRYASAGTYDLATGGMLMFGGFTANEQAALALALNDLWRYSEGAWTQVTPLEDGAPWPPPRYFSAFSYDDARREAVLFGGCPSTNTAVSLSCNNAGTQSNDLWLLADDAWRERTPNGTEAWPLGRWGHALAYDAARGETVLFGGAEAASTSATCINADACVTTWLWDGESWRAHRPSDQLTAYPAPRFVPAMAYDPLRQRTVMWGCDDATCVTTDTWEWDGQSWTRFAGEAGPPSLQGASMAFDPSAGEVMLTGGRAACFINCPADEIGADSLSAAVWHFNGTRWRQRYNGVSDSASGQLTDASGGPAARSLPAVAKDLATDAIVVVGGSVLLSVDPLAFEVAPLNLAHTFDGIAWRSEPTTGTEPPSLVGPTGVSHPTSGVLIFGGGLGLRGTNELWHLDGGAWTLRAQSSPAPPPRFDPAATLHGDEVLVFGGGDGQASPGVCPPGSAGAAWRCSRGDTWLYNATTDSWREVTAGPMPGARESAALVYDSNRGVSVLFGGIRDVATAEECSDGDLSFVACEPNDVWEFDGTAWSDVTPTVVGPDGAPRGRRSGSLVYDPSRQTVFTVGGVAAEDCDGGKAPACEILWEWDGAQWGQLPIDDSSPDGPSALAGDSVYMHVIGDELTAIAALRGEDETGSAIGVFRLDDRDRKAPAHVLHVPRAAFLQGPGDYQVTDAAVSWFGGGTGADQAGNAVAGATLWGWDGATWTPLASNEAPADAPTLLSWHSVPADPVTLQLGTAPPDASVHLALTSRGSNGRGQATVASDHVQLTLRYRLVTKPDE